MKLAAIDQQNVIGPLDTL